MLSSYRCGFRYPGAGKICRPSHGWDDRSGVRIGIIRFGRDGSCEQCSKEDLMGSKHFMSTHEYIILHTFTKCISSEALGTLFGASRQLRRM